MRLKHTNINSSIRHYRTNPPGNSVFRGSVVISHDKGKALFQYLLVIPFSDTEWLPFGGANRTVMALPSVKVIVTLRLFNTKPKKSIFSWGWNTDFTRCVLNPRLVAKLTASTALRSLELKRWPMSKESSICPIQVCAIGRSLHKPAWGFWWKSLGQRTSR